MFSFVFSDSPSQGTCFSLILVEILFHNWDWSVNWFRKMGSWDLIYFLLECFIIIFLFDFGFLVFMILHNHVKRRQILGNYEFLAWRIRVFLWNFHGCKIVKNQNKGFIALWGYWILTLYFNLNSEKINLNKEDRNKVAKIISHSLFNISQSCLRLLNRFILFWNIWTGMAFLCIPKQR